MIADLINQWFCNIACKGWSFFCDGSALFVESLDLCWMLTCRLVTCMFGSLIQQNSRIGISFLIQLLKQLCAWFIVVNTSSSFHNQRVALWFIVPKLCKRVYEYDTWPVTEEYRGNFSIGMASNMACIINSKVYLLFIKEIQYECCMLSLKLMPQEVWFVLADSASGNDCRKAGLCIAKVGVYRK